VRIWHQSFTVLGDVPAYEKALRDRCSAVVEAGTEVVLHGLSPNTYPTNYPGGDLTYAYLYALHSNQWILNGLRAESEGYDAYAMCTTPNPMIREMRSLVDIPVIGYGETSTHLASQLGQRFVVLTFIHGIEDLYVDRVKEYGLWDRCGGVRHIGFTFKDVLEGYENPGPLIERFVTSARRIITETGADVLTGGSLPLSVLLATHGLFRVDDVPVIDGLAVTLMMAEMMVRLRERAGLFVSRKGFFNRAPPRERVLQLLDFYGLSRFTERNK
jgi:Asp/Glu/hydantoin racemase